MAMFCTRCSTSHEQALHCPTCGNALVYTEARKRRLSYGELARGWQHTDWGRFVIGVGLAQGLFYGLYHLLRSIFQAVNGEALNPETMPLVEVACVQALQLFGLLVGCVTAGVARRQAIVLGVYIGVANSILSLLLGQWPAYAFTTYWVYIQPFIQIVVGSAGALVSSLIWKPLSVATLPETPSRMAKKLGAKRPRLSKVFAGPVSWLRVLLGALLAAGGCYAAKPALYHVLNNTNWLSLDAYSQEAMLLWEVKGLALLLGGFLAGAATANGLKQGLVVGIVTAALMNALLAYQQAHLQTVELTTLLAFVLPLAGAWFGAQVIPPASARRRLQGAGPGTT